jgi:hypothetical protein
MAEGAPDRRAFAFRAAALPKRLAPRGKPHYGRPRTSLIPEGIMAPRTPKTPAKTPAAKSAADKPAKVAKPADKAKPAAAKPAKAAPKAGAAASSDAVMKIKELVEAVAAATGGKKPEVKKTVEATLAAIGTALAAKTSLALPPLGKIRVAKVAAGALTLKLRLADPARGAAKPLADDGEDD